MTPSRKRGCHSMDEETEFMPLSKRINNLHINNSNMLMEQPKGLMSDAWSIPSYLPASTSLPDSPPLSVQSDCYANPAPYNPELTESQNPYYYTSNKLLYEMYLARQERSNQ